VADLRAPTPSAAAELVVKDKRELKNTLYHLSYRLESQMAQTLQELRTDLNHLRKILGSPRKAIESYFLRIDELFGRLQRMISWTIERCHEKNLHIRKALSLQSPKGKLGHQRLLSLEASQRLEQHFNHTIGIQRERLKGLMGRLDSLSPLSILQRGYSITRKIRTSRS